MRKIIFVSRLDADCSLGAYLLCDIAPRLTEKYPDTQILIVGGGEEYDNINKNAEALNRFFNRRLILTVGNVPDPSVLFDECSLFVGASRAALEAMAHGLPVLLLGNEGHLGLLEKKNLKLAKNTNFTCRGRGRERDMEQLRAFLFAEICRFFDLPSHEIKNMSSFVLNVIKNGYTSCQMARKTVGVYEKTLARYHNGRTAWNIKSPKIVICGYYGQKNLGDEAILLSIRKKLREFLPNAQICVIKSKDPINILTSLRKSNVFILGGGSLLQNSTSNASLFYYLSMILLSRLLSDTTVMLSNGVGPIKDRVFSRNTLLYIISKALSTIDMMSVRDRRSLELLSSLLPEKKIALIPDPTLLYYDTLPKSHSKNLEKSGYFVYVPCSNDFKSGAISVCEAALSLRLLKDSRGLSLRIAVLNRKDDLATAKKLCDLIKDAKILNPKSPDELFSLLSRASFVISQRYHGVLFTALANVPALAVSDDPKMLALCEELYLPSCHSPKALRSFHALLRAVEDAEKHHSSNSVKRSNALRESADLSRSSLEKLFQNFKNALDKKEHLFYNIEKDT